MRTLRFVPVLIAASLAACGPSSHGASDAGTGSADAAIVVDGCTPTPEVCNGLDDDCDGIIDEGFQDNGVYDTAQACGSCANDCVAQYGALPNATGTCNTTGMPTCQMTCNAGFFDLDGNLDDGCEVEVDMTAIYVSTGDAMAADDGTCGIGPVGTGAGNHPCKTIAHGILKAAVIGATKVLVANGLYVEPVAMQNGISLLGGYDPVTWQRDVAATTTTIAGVASVGVHDHTVDAANITMPTTLEGFVIYGSTNQKPNGNSYAIYAIGATQYLTIRSNVVFGGVGGPGSDGSNGSNGTNGTGGTGRNPNLTVADGSYDAKDAAGTGECNTSNNRQYTNGGATTCAATATNGGNGGGNQCPVMSNCDLWDSNFGCLQATTNFHWNNYTPLAGVTGDSGGALGGAAGAGGGQGNDMIQIYAAFYGGYICYIPPGQTYGLDGSNGGDGSAGAGVGGCSVSAGAIVGNDWTGGAAPIGNGGGNGGGGGGGGAGGGGKCENDGHGHSVCSDGGSKDTLGGHGGGGGAGGCGGVGGGAAAPGGGAFDIFLVGTTAPTIEGNQLFRGTGGSGGAGGGGGQGGSGGIGAPGGTTGVPVIFCTDTAGRGGDGGTGGDAAGGGGGCGGSSFGIYTSGIGTTNYCAHGENTVLGGGGGAGGLGGYSIINPGGDGTAGNLVDCSFN